MNRKKKEMPALPMGYIVLAIAFTALLLVSSLICSMTPDPVSYTGVAAKVITVLCMITGGMTLRKKGGTFTECVIFSATVFILLLILSMPGKGKIDCYITDAIAFASSVAAFFIPSLFKEKRRRRKI